MMCNKQRGPEFVAAMVFFGLLSYMARGDGSLPSASPQIPTGIEKFTIKTISRENAEVPFYVRVPRDYLANPKKKLYRVLFSCPILNGGGLTTVTQNGALLAAADERGWFVVSATFHTDKAKVRDRKECYYYPETFSGQAVLDALDQIQQKYPIATVGLLLEGLSGGSQFVHRFAIWAPGRVAAIVVNSSSWFDEPKPSSQQIAWMLTVGESDPSYENSLAFVAQLKATGAVPLFRSFIGMMHERHGLAPKLEIEFLKYYDDLTRSSMAARAKLLYPDAKPPLPAAAMPYVGDAQDWTFVKNTPDNVEDIPEDSRVYLPSLPVAQAWGNADEDPSTR